MLTDMEIFEMAREAAQSAYDAHKSTEIPSAETTADFMAQTAYEEAADDHSARQAWDRWKDAGKRNAFTAAYYREIKVLRKLVTE